MLTSWRRLPPPCLFTYSLMFPWSIQADIIESRFCSKSTPSNGKIFGCRRCRHATASRQNSYKPHVRKLSRRMKVDVFTLWHFSKSLVMVTRMVFMATVRLLCWARNITV